MDTEKVLNNLQTMVDEVSATNSKTEKIELLAKHLADADTQQIVKRTYSPYDRFGVTSNAIKNADMQKIMRDRTYNVYSDIADLLDALSTRKVTGHQAIADVYGFITLYNEHADLIYRILDKDLEMRATATSINKACPKLVPTFDVALAQEYAKRKAKVDLDAEVWVAMKKLDGVRLITICNKEANTIMFYSRQGNEFTSLEKVRQALQPVLDASNYSFVLDGELCVVDADGNDDFKAAVSQVKRKNGEQMQSPRYYVFDCLLQGEFEAKKGTQSYTSRIVREPMRHLDGDTVSTVPVLQVESHEHVQKLLEKGVAAGWEGIILRKDVGYEGKRTNSLLKNKTFQDAEFEVKDVDFEEHRLIIDGKQVKRRVLAQVYIDYKGTRVGVGSGFSKAERLFYADNPDTLIGKIITVQYFAESKDKDGTPSLKWPTVKIVHGNKRDV